MDKFRVNLRKKMDKYIKLNGISYKYFNRVDGVKDVRGIKQVGSTRFKTLFEISKFLNIDIRNFLIFDDNTYIFENSFDTFEEFYCFLCKKFKEFRLNKNLKLLDISNRINISNTTISSFESARIVISLDTFYRYLEVLEITSDEFFLKDEKYQIVGNQIKNEISIDEFNNRIYEIEEINGRELGKSVLYDFGQLPTLHVFLKICKSLRVSPRDFFDFEKKNFDYDSVVIDLKEYIRNIKHILEPKGSKIPRYVKLDTIFLFCNEHSIKIVDFFDEHCIEEYLSQLFLSIS